MWMRTLFCFLIIIPFLVLGQETEEINIAKEYILAGDMIKAKDSYAKLSKKSENIPLIFSDYVSIMTNKEDFNEINKFIKKAIKFYPNNIYYKLDHYVLIKSYESNSKNVEKEFQSLMKEISINKEWFGIAGSYLMNKKCEEEALKIFINGRKTWNDPYMYIEEIVQIYSLSGDINAIIDEVLIYVAGHTNELTLAENILQEYINNDKAFTYLEEKLYSSIQKYPNELVYNELLYWIMVQKKNFNKALIQARAIDKRKTNDGRKLVALARIAIENKAYEDAINILSIIKKEQKNNDAYDYAIKNIIFSKEELIKNKYPVNAIDINSLSNDYQQLIKEINKNQSIVEPLRKWALLKAFYLNQRDTAIVMLQSVIKLAANDSYQRDYAKVDLADIYLLNDEPWESVLLYYQVEKTQKEQTLGYEAKLKNAKLSYFKGEFQLAKEHLDVLKIATTREIANDALYLSLMIRDNIIEDSTGTALMYYSKIGLLIFQNKIPQALDSLNKMLVIFPYSSLTDDVYYDIAKIYRKIGKYDLAIVASQKIITDYASEILADDALMLQAKIYEDDIKNLEKAKEVYQNLLLNYSSSIYCDEARKRFRLLRGDKL
ncbi:MAG: hypothetical protein EAZ07_05700 [Cytophagales bacterium]|nr:MAG: hypothetical protein EAZ07_05700 [Cytophagales bacterium]